MTDPSGPSTLGLIGWDHYEYVFSDLEEGRRFLRNKLDVPEAGRRGEREARALGEDAVFFRAGRVAFSCIAPREVGSRSERWLKRHPEGVRTLAFRCRDLEATRRVLEGRGATIRTPMTTSEDHLGRAYKSFDIATPLGDVAFCFVERSADALPPGFAPVEDKEARNRHGFQVVDHVTSNFLTLEPYVTWLRDVMGFTEYWRVQFHTTDVKGGQGGTGLFSIVMWDKESGVKMANNEPLVPNYEGSQIYTFVEENKGPGVQHVAFHLPNILSAVGDLRGAGIQFLDTPGAYYDLLPARMERKKVGQLAEDKDALRKLGVLVDGADGKYLLQIFSAEGKVLRGTPQGGPFFYELIQRRGALGFGEGNFRALFESIEREQEQRGGRLTVSNPWSGT